MAHMIKVSDSSVREIIGGKIKTADGTVSTIVGGKIRTSDTSVKSIEFWKYKYELVKSITKTTSTVESQSYAVPANTVAVYARVDGYHSLSGSNMDATFYAVGCLRNGTFSAFSFDVNRVDGENGLCSGHIRSIANGHVTYQFPTVCSTARPAVCKLYAIRAISPVWTNSVRYEAKDPGGYSWLEIQANWFMLPFKLNESGSSFVDFGASPDTIPFRDVNGIWWDPDNDYDRDASYPTGYGSQSGNVRYDNGTGYIRFNSGNSSRYYSFSRLTIG